MNSGTASRIAWASVTPALLWTLAFFALPFLAMAIVSVYPKGGAGFESR